VPETKDEEEIRALYAAWIDASRNQDVETLLQFVTEDAVFLAPGQPPIRGKAGVKDVFGRAFGRYAAEQSFAIEELQILGDWAFCWGVDSTVMRPLGGGEEVRARGMGLSLLRKGADGAWRFARGINNMTREAPATK
jgi:uncharacterized protein (TIGR02246 family)